MELIKNSYLLTRSHHGDQIQSLLEENKIQLDSSYLDEDEQYKDDSKLLSSHIRSAYQTYSLFLEDLKDITTIMNNGTRYVIDYSTNNKKPENFNSIKEFLYENLNLDIEIESISDEAVIFFIPYFKFLNL